MQVIFHENNDRRYLQGKLSDSQIWIYGDIRSGRTKETRTKLTKKIVEVVCEIADVSKYDIWVFLNCLEPGDMAGYGEILPDAGKEEEWFEKLPKNLQTKLKD